MSDKEQLVSDEKNSKDEISLAIENNACGICRAMGLPICKGHAGGSSGEKTSGAGGESTKQESTLSSPQVSNNTRSVELFSQTLAENQLIFMQTIASDKIIEYIAGSLAVESDRLRGNLTFKLNPGLTNNELSTAQAYLKVVEAEFDAFKSQLIDQGVSTKNFSAVIKNHTLEIHISNPKYYDAFIKHLANKNLLPIPNLTQQSEKTLLLTNEKEKSQNFHPNPFSTELKRK